MSASRAHPTKRRRRVNIMVDPEKLAAVVVELGAKSSSAAIDEALDNVLERKRLVADLRRTHGMFPEFALPEDE